MIVDAHAHIGQLHRLKPLQTQAMILHSMAKYTIDFTLISSGSAEEFSANGRLLKSRPSQAELNQEVIDFVQLHPDRLGALLWCKPSQETADSALEKLIQENRRYIFGLKFHPFCSQVAANDSRMEPYYALAKKYDLPLLFHTAVDRCSSILFLEKAAKAHPELTFVAAHMELLSDNLEAIRVVKENPNVYGDTAWVTPKKAFLAIQSFGPDKLMFGTDNPIDGLDTLNHPYYKTYRGRSFKRKVGSSAYSKLMSDNAIRVYRLPLSHK